ncbi:hypothetical protein [Nonomuraea marmarensis]
MPPAPVSAPALGVWDFLLLVGVTVTVAVLVLVLLGVLVVGVDEVVDVLVEVDVDVLPVVTTRLAEGPPEVPGWHSYHPAPFT